MKYIEDLREGDMIQETYLCKNKQSLKTKAGKTYFSLLLQDKTGTADAKIWDLSNGIDHFETMDYIRIDAQVTSFQGSLQLNVRRVRRAFEGEYDPADFLPVSTKNIDDMYNELLEYLNSVEEPHLKELALSFFEKDEQFKKAFKFHSAAKSVHHGFVGGLLEHTLGVVRLCDYYTKNYEILNRDLLIVAAAFHDIGKLDELSIFPENDYTDDGQLLGHIIMGIEIVGDRIKEIEGFPPKIASELKHCIAAHHGELEYGSPKKPALAEAVALNFADNTDAKMETLTELFRGADDSSEWLGYNKFFESNIRKTSF